MASAWRRRKLKKIISKDMAAESKMEAAAANAKGESGEKRQMNQAEER